MKRLSATIAPRARRDLADIRAWLLKEAGSRVAARMVGAIRQRIDDLRSWPSTGVAQPDLGGYTRFTPVSSYVIYYEVQDDRLTVLRVLHAARDRRAIMASDAQDSAL